MHDDNAVADDEVKNPKLISFTTELKEELIAWLCLNLQLHVQPKDKTMATVFFSKLAKRCRSRFLHHLDFPVP